MGFFNILFKEAAHVRQASQDPIKPKVSKFKETPQHSLTRNLSTKESKLLKDQKKYYANKTKWAHLVLLFFVVEEVPSGALVETFVVYLLLLHYF
jgi:predicted AAA+ superfamily ATPase